MSSRPIKDYMTVTTHTIARDDTLQEAERLMQKRSIRHLPVVEGGKVIGLLSQTDARMIASIDGVDPKTVQVALAMTPLPYVVPPEEDLASVSRVMADRHYGCAIVVDGGEVAGIFTVTDAVRVLADRLSAEV